MDVTRDPPERRAARAMAASGAWSALLGLALGAATLGGPGLGGQPALRLLAVTAALLHLIFAIWFIEGRGAPAFARATALGRAAAAPLFLYGALRLRAGGPAWLAAYCAAAAAGDAVGALVTARALRGAPRPAPPPARLPLANRLIFGIYLLVLGAWLAIDGASLLRLLHAPAGPAPVLPLTLGAQVVLLGCYNVVAARRGIAPLLRAGVRGGVMTCAIFLALVAAGLLHPATLLIPAVDLVSVLGLGARRLYVRLQRARWR